MRNIDSIDKRQYLIHGTLLAALVICLVSSDTPYITQLLIWAALNSVLGASMRFVLLIGETNMACGAIYGISAYLTAIAVTNGIDAVPLVILAAAICACIVGVVFGSITLRVKGPYFMLIGFAFTEVVRLSFTRIDYIGGNSGMVGIYAPQSMDVWMPAIYVALCYVVILALFAMEKSPFGRLLRAIRNNDKVVETLGISTLWIKLVCFCVAATAIGIAGSIHAYSYHVISPSDFGFLVPVYALAYAKVGGEGHISGSVIGACFLTVVAQLVQGSGSLQYIIFGGVIVLTMFGLRGGILQLWTLLIRPNKVVKQEPSNIDSREAGAQGDSR